MKESIKFAAVCFTLQIFFVVIIYVLFPKVYPGDSFTIIWFYIINLIIALFLFPVFTLIVRRLPFKGKLNYVSVYFFGVLIIINILPLLVMHVFWTFEIVIGLFKRPFADIGLIELFNPILSFAISYWFFRKNRLWESN